MFFTRAGTTVADDRRMFFREKLARLPYRSLHASQQPGAVVRGRVGPVAGRIALSRGGLPYGGANYSLLVEGFPYAGAGEARCTTSYSRGGTSYGMFARDMDE